MSIWKAFRGGLRLLGRNKRILFWMWGLSLLLALAPTLLVSRSIKHSLGNSFKAEKLAQGYDDIWFQEFEADAQALASTFEPTVAGAGAVFKALDGFVSGTLFKQFPAILAVGIAYLLLWAFAAGGILTAFEKNISPSFEEFAAAGARYLGRFVRLMVFVGLLYWLIYALLAPWLDEWFESLSADTIDERLALLWKVFTLLIFLAAVWLVNILADYAKILTVLERRRSMLLSLLRSVRLCAAHFLRVGGLYLLVTLLGIVLMAIYALVAPGASDSTWTGVLLALLLGQIYIAARIGVRLLFFASQMELCRSLIAAPEPAPMTEPPIASEPLLPPQEDHLEDAAAPEQEA